MINQSKINHFVLLTLLELFMSKTPNLNFTTRFGFLACYTQTEDERRINLGTKDGLIYPSISLLENGRDIMPTPQ
jgi:hypothetical protein